MLTKLLINFVLVAFIDIAIADPLVQLPNGLIRGREAVTIQNKRYYVFEKIPYATPPVGKLRFKGPQPPQNWEGILNTTHADVSCYQNNIFLTQSEDCLFVNIYTPKLPSDTKNDSLLPTMLFIHGGGFVSGSGGPFKSDFIIDSDIILVTINYRLGIFGFLSTQDDIIPGNFGLKDQLLALKWIHDNINLFGGDPDRITIFGQSAGAISIGYHLLNQQSQGLFSGAILESGSALMPAGYQRKSREIAFKTATLLNDTFSTNNDSVDLLEFLQSVDAKDLNEAAFKYQNSYVGPDTIEIYHGTVWSPVIEVKNPDAFITKKMYGLLEAGNVVSVPIMIGINSEEMLGFVASDKRYETYLGYYDNHLEWLLPADMVVSDEKNRTEIGRAIRDIYTQGELFLDHLGNGVRFYSDTGFTRPLRKYAELYSKISKTYFYQFSYDGELGGIDAHYDGAESVSHNEELFYLFCLFFTCDHSAYPKADQITSQRMVKLWTNFAKYRNPTPEPSELLQNITWPLVDEDFPYLDINENLEIKNRPKDETYTKWVEIYNSLNFTDFDTY